jgi:hypothetical protein
MKPPSLEKKFCTKPNMVVGLGLKAAFPHTCARQLNPHCKRLMSRGRICMACIAQYRLQCKDESAVREYCFHSMPQNTDNALKVEPLASDKSQAAAGDGYSGYRRRLRASTEAVGAVGGVQESHHRHRHHKKNHHQMALSSGSLTAGTKCGRHGMDAQSAAHSSPKCEHYFQREFQPIQIWVYGIESTGTETYRLAIQSETDKHHLDYDS